MVNVAKYSSTMEHLCEVMLTSLMLAEHGEMLDLRSTNAGLRQSRINTTDLTNIPIMFIPQKGDKGCVWMFPQALWRDEGTIWDNSLRVGWPCRPCDTPCSVVELFRFLPWFVSRTPLSNKFPIAIWECRRVRQTFSDFSGTPEIVLGCIVCCLNSWGNTIEHITKSKGWS